MRAVRQLRGLHLDAESDGEGALKCSSAGTHCCSHLERAMASSDAVTIEWQVSPLCSVSRS
jgi:hypothetical protein